MLHGAPHHLQAHLLHGRARGALYEQGAGHQQSKPHPTDDGEGTEQHRAGPHPLHGVNGIRLGRTRRARRGPAWPPLQAWFAVTATAAFSVSKAELCRLASGWSKGPPQRNPNWLSAFLALSQMDRALARMNER